MITQEVVDDNLTCAQENGYFTDLSEWTVDEIVIDLQCYSVDCEDAPDDVLTPLVKAWYDARIVNPSTVGSTPTPPANKE